jgi:predicted RNase H-like HicB family nuclease
MLIWNVTQRKNDIIKKNIRKGIMGTARFVYWQDDDMWLGYLEEYPDYMTQGKSLRELKENLKDIHDDLTSGAIPYVRKIAELEIA